MAILVIGQPRTRFPIWPALAMLGAILLVLGGWRLLADRRAAEPSSEPAIERQGRQFVRLALTLGRIAPDELDFYFGPPALRPPSGKPSLPALRADLGDLAVALRDGPGPRDARRARLAERTDRLRALVDTMGPAPALSWDETASRLYGLPRPALDTAAFDRARMELDRLLPGPGPLSRRVDLFRARFIIPEGKRRAVFARALGECRRRTLQHWPLPPSERLDVRWTDTVDAAWHRYQGDFRSILEINPAAVAFLGSAIDVACHEGYPGHHAQFVLAEAAAGPAGLPIEDRVVLVRSPAAVLREGAADYGVSLAFPEAERRAFERDVLMPLAGFPPSEAAHFERVRTLLDQLAPAAYPVLRDYRDGRLDEAEAQAALRRDALIASPQPLVDFTTVGGAFVAGYTAVREQVRQLVSTSGAGDPWTRLRALIDRADDTPLARPDSSTARN